MMKDAHSALGIALSPRERTGVRETLMAPATIVFRGGVRAMTVCGSREPMPHAFPSIIKHSFQRYLL
jgi:hypothetical protein